MLNRRSFLQVVAASALSMGLVTASSVSASAFTNVRYVSAFGSDSNPGTEAAPWKSLARVREAIVSGELKRGDAALLKRGDVFYVANNHLPSNQGTEGRLTIGAYGTGERPKLLGYKVSNAGQWTNTGNGVWRLNLTPGSADFSGNVTQASTNVGFIRVAGVIRGWKKTSLSSLGNQWDFYSDATHVYVKSTFDPGAGVEIAVQQDCFRLASNTHLDGLYIAGHGAHGVATGGKSVRITDCFIEDIGGSQLKSDGTRYGNGVELYAGAADVVTEYCWIRETYDVAYTMQGTNGSWTDCHFRFNRLENCNMMFEIWSEGSGPGHVRCTFNDNVCIDAGYSWASTIRPDKSGTGTHFLSYNLQLPVDIEMTRNKFLGARDNMYRCSGSRQVPSGVNTHHNTIKLGAGKQIAYSPAGENPEKIEQWQQFVARTGKEAGTVWEVLATGQCKA